MEPKAIMIKTVFNPERDTAKAWMAGFIDGEGSIGLNQEYDIRKGAGYFHYRPSLQIVNTDRGSIEIFYKYIGCGDFRMVNRDKLGYRKQQPVYRLNVRKAEPLLRFLKEIEPYLTIKKRRAQLVIEYIENRLSKPGRGRYNPKTEADKEIWGKLMLLNLRGAQAREFKNTL